MENRTQGKKYKPIYEWKETAAMTERGFHMSLDFIVLVFRSVRSFQERERTDRW
jgi:hypothetical protein